MNLKKLFELQRQLDEHIEKEHPREPGEDRLAKKILALQVKLGELANYWRGFKFWSHDQEPRTFQLDICHACDGRGFTLGFENSTEDCEDCDGTGTDATNPLFEEYVDCLYFILSIGLELKIEKYKPFALKKENIIEQFIELNFQTSLIFTLKKNVDAVSIQKIRGRCYLVVDLFIALGEMLGFTWEQIEEAYMKKNAVNHQRQESGY
ncbi:dUTP diphosphatase [Anoxybacillus rupiensis]|uniref:dUTP diphosphatase n=1 Tax=Anoxybacteroides rupiense TaxID=311460 RepID=A0ABD5IWG0_9BACL|nr:dUTP diphosphatase [Anoxybacillus rupiensis]